MWQKLSDTHFSTCFYTLEKKFEIFRHLFTAREGLVSDIPGTVGTEKSLTFFYSVGVFCELTCEALAWLWRTARQSGPRLRHRSSASPLSSLLCMHFQQENHAVLRIWARNCKRLWSPRIDFKEPSLPGSVGYDNPIFLKFKHWTLDPDTKRILIQQA